MVLIFQIINRHTCYDFQFHIHDPRSFYRRCKKIINRPLLNVSWREVDNWEYIFWLQLISHSIARIKKTYYFWTHLCKTRSSKKPAGRCTKWLLRKIKKSEKSKNLTSTWGTSTSRSSQTARNCTTHELRLMEDSCECGWLSQKPVRIIRRLPDIF